MRKIQILNVLTMFLFFTVLLLPKASMALPVSYTDLWDISNGTTVGNNSGALYYSSTYKSDIRKMFGDDNYAGTLPGPLLFRDYLPGWVSVPAGFTHFVEWSTANPVTLRSFSLYASNEGMDRRAFNHFELFVGDGIGNWTSIYGLQINSYDDYNGPTYNDWWQLELAVDLTPVVAQYFRAEFIQAPWSSPSAVGPRIHELDGYDTFLNGSTGAPVPEPATMLLLGSGLIGLAGFKRKFRKS
jgi:PEP-CTERM motif-containing protein